MGMYDSPSDSDWNVIGRAAPIIAKDPRVRIFSYYDNYSMSHFPNDSYAPVLRYDHWVEEDMTRNTKLYGHLYRIRDNNNQISFLEGHQPLINGEIRNIRPGKSPNNMIWKYKINLQKAPNNLYWTLPIQNSIPAYYD